VVQRGKEVRRSLLACFFSKSEFFGAHHFRVPFVKNSEKTARVRGSTTCQVDDYWINTGVYIYLFNYDMINEREEKGGEMSFILCCFWHWHERFLQL